MKRFRRFIACCIVFMLAGVIPLPSELLFTERAHADNKSIYALAIEFNLLCKFVVAGRHGLWKYHCGNLSVNNL